ncbi:MAG: copper resistance protein CopC [Candidatus Rokubacteria bacterium]|nr:copper resistance protein CopC [Candidatus Rokubacteria bacterium]
MSARGGLSAWLVVGALLIPGAAEPHAFLVKSAPARRAVLTYPPARVDLWFNERLEPAYSTLSVWSEAGVQVDTRDATVGPNDPTRLGVPLASLGPGRYTVRFRVLSVDGHVVESSFTFSVRAPGGETR